MQKRISVLLTLALLLAALYVSFFTDWFGRESIQIIVQHRPIPQRADPGKNWSAPENKFYSKACSILLSDRPTVNVSAEIYCLSERIYLRKSAKRHS